jgi:7-carboxy-7-deazaguanine synthase (Cx14CxxC type)
MTYSVKEVFFTLQGEGAHAGRVAVFCRFSGCNLWSGREEDRAGAICKFCDTDFVGTDGLGGGKFADADSLAKYIDQFWGDADPKHKYVVFTGGEPLLQLDEPLIKAVKLRGFEVAIETNGTLELPKGVDWVCLSPKSGSDLRILQADEIKLVWPQLGYSEDIDKVLARYEKMSFKHFFIQPLDDAQQSQHIQEAVRICQMRPKWRLSMQNHKWIGIR